MVRVEIHRLEIRKAGGAGLQRHTLVEASVLELTNEQMTNLVKECDAVVSCLGHVISFQGIFGEPKQLCTEATKCLCKAIESNCPLSPVRFI